MMKNGYAKQMFPDLFKEQEEPKWITLDPSVSKPSVASYWSENFIEAERIELEGMVGSAKTILAGLSGAGIPKQVAEEIINKAFHKRLNLPMHE